MNARRCQGRRRKWRGATLGVFACGRKATRVLETHVGLTRHHYVCDDDECRRFVTNGYPASSRAL